MRGAVAGGAGEAKRINPGPHLYKVQAPEGPTW